MFQSPPTRISCGFGCVRGALGVLQASFAAAFGPFGGTGLRCHVLLELAKEKNGEAMGQRQENHRQTIGNMVV